VISRWRK